MQIAYPENGITNTQAKLRNGNYLTQFRLNSCCVYQRNYKFSVGILLLPGNDDSEVIQGVQHL